MKYTILINQAGIVDANLHTKTDVVDWSLLDYIFAFQQSPKGLFHENKVWINYAHLISEMPLLGLNAKNSVANRVKKVRDLGLIDTYQSPIDQKLYARTTELYYDITQFKGEPRIQKEFTPVPTQEHPVPTQEHPVPVEVHKLDNQLTNNQEHKNNSLSSEREETAIFTQELSPPSANRPTVDKEVETLTADDVVKYLAARLMTLPLEEAQLFLTYYRGQGWYVGNTPVSSWRDKAEGWFLRYKQRQNEAAKKPVASGRKPKQDFTNLPDYSFDTSGDEKPSDVIDSFATAIFPKIGGE